MNDEPDIFRNRKNSRSNTLEQRDCRIDIRALVDTERCEHCIRMRNRFSDKRAKPLGMAKIEHSHSAPRDLVFVSRPDSAASGSYLLARRAQRVDELVIRENQMRAVTDVKSSLNVDAVGNQLVDFREECVRIENNSVSDCASHSRMENTAGDLVKDE